MKIRVAAIGLLAVSGLVWAAPDLNETFNGLKDAVEKKDAAQVKTLAGQTSKEAKELMKEADPGGGGTEAWKARQQFAKDADDYSAYSLAATGMQVPASIVDLTDTLIAQDPKSKHIDTVAPYYLQALGKQGAAKANAGAQKILAGRPENEDALLQLANGNPQYANKLVQVMRTKAKPEGVSDADWERRKSSMIINGTYAGAVGPCARNAWAECDRAMKAAEPVLKGSAMAGTMYFYLGAANYQLGLLTQDKAKRLAGLNYTKQAAGMPGPSQGQAAQNVGLMARELGVAAK